MTSGNFFTCTRFMNYWLGDHKIRLYFYFLYKIFSIERDNNILNSYTLNGCYDSNS